MNKHGLTEESFCTVVFIEGKTIAHKVLYLYYLSENGLTFSKFSCKSPFISALVASKPQYSYYL